MTDKELLQKKYDSGSVTESDLSFGRTMPYGKYKGKYIYYLLVSSYAYCYFYVAKRYAKNQTSILLAVAYKNAKRNKTTFLQYP